MKRETFCKETMPGLDVTQVPNKTIVLPFDQETYPEFIIDKPAYKAHLNMWIEAAPELFPETIGMAGHCMGSPGNPSDKGYEFAAFSPKRIKKCG